MKEKIKTTIYIDKETYNRFRIYAITLNTSVSSLIEQFMKETNEKLKNN